MWRSDGSRIASSLRESPTSFLGSTQASPNASLLCLSQSRLRKSPPLGYKKSPPCLRAACRDFLHQVLAAAAGFVLCGVPSFSSLQFTRPVLGDPRLIPFVRPPSVDPTELRRCSLVPSNFPLQFFPFFLILSWGLPERPPSFFGGPRWTSPTDGPTSSRFTTPSLFRLSSPP